MILNIISKYVPEYIQSILMEDLHLDYYTVTYRHSGTRSIHEFIIEDKTGEEVCLTLETLQEIAADLNLSPWELRIIVTPKEHNNE